MTAVERVARVARLYATVKPCGFHCTRWKSAEGTWLVAMAVRTDDEFGLESVVVELTDFEYGAAEYLFAKLANA